MLIALYISKIENKKKTNKKFNRFFSTKKKRDVHTRTWVEGDNGAG